MKLKKNHIKKIVKKMKNTKSGIKLPYLSSGAGIKLMMDMNSLRREANAFYKGDEKIEVYKSEYESLKKELQKLKDYIVDKALSE